jgi:small subunit ribosomal protein S6
MTSGGNRFRQVPSSDPTSTPLNDHDVDQFALDCIRNALPDSSSTSGCRSGAFPEIDLSADRKLQLLGYTRSPTARGCEQNTKILWRQLLASALREYELIVVLSPEIGDDVVEGSIERVQQTVTSRGGEIVETKPWGRRRLAYPIKRFMEGNYVENQIRLDPAQVSSLEQTLRISEEVIRHLIVTKEAPAPAAAAPAGN